jgi:hypothetical protein
MNWDRNRTPHAMMMPMETGGRVTRGEIGKFTRPFQLLNKRVSIEISGQRRSIQAYNNAMDTLTRRLHLRSPGIPLPEFRQRLPAACRAAVRNTTGDPEMAIVAAGRTPAWSAAAQWVAKLVRSIGHER